jgi:hypothetical protein
MTTVKKIFAALVFIQVIQLCVAFFICAGWGWSWEHFLGAYIIPLALVVCLLFRFALEWSVSVITKI